MTTNKRLTRLNRSTSVITRSIRRHANPIYTKGDDDVNCTELCSAITPKGNLIIYAQQSEHQQAAVLLKNNDSEFLVLISDKKGGKPIIQTGLSRLTDLAFDLGTEGEGNASKKIHDRIAKLISKHKKTVPV